MCTLLDIHVISLNINVHVQACIIHVHTKMFVLRSRIQFCTDYFNIIVIVMLKMGKMIFITGPFAPNSD